MGLSNLCSLYILILLKSNYWNFNTKILILFNLRNKFLPLVKKQKQMMEKYTKPNFLKKKLKEI